MKSRTSSFNLTVLKKDMARFAPAWGAYLILLLLVLMNLASSSEAYWRLRDMPNATLAMGWVNLIYGCVVAQLLFGDLYNSRLCNALHAMPVTREGWFLTHCLSGLLSSLLPNLAIVLVALPVMRLEAGWPALLWWLLGAELQYVFFFGVAVLCVMLSGNRLGQLALYAMINFAGLAAYWLASVIYEPLLYGIQVNGELFYPFCPVAEITQIRDVLAIDFARIEDEFGSILRYEIYGVTPGSGWGYMAIIAAVGVAALGLALVLYRKRKLECAGDFVAFKCMEPVVLVLVTVFAGGFFHLFGDVFGLRMKYVLIYCGMVVGYFACRMLLERNTRVFRLKTALHCAVVLIAFSLTLLVTKLDPLGITTYMPDVNEVESITFSNSYSLHRHADMKYTVTDAEDIEAILSVHDDCITKEASSQPAGSEESYYLLNLRLEYKLKNGRTVNRFYNVHPHCEAGQILEGYYARPECVLGFQPEQAPEMAKYIYRLYTDGMERELYELEGMDLLGLLDAVIADCEAGNMAQFDGFHYPDNYDRLLDTEDEKPEGSGYDLLVTWLEIGWDGERMKDELVQDSTGSTIISYRGLRVYESCVNTIRWLDENDLLGEETRKELVKRFSDDGPTAVFVTE